MMNDFLPINRKDMKQRGWEQVDFVLVTGDAYVDHPSFGTAIISRLLESRGYKVAILAQPDWKSPDDFKRFGRPRLGFLINSGNVDSMVNNFSVFKHRRRRDVYSPGGRTGKRPDRALIVYCNRAREAYRDVPIIIGGLEASLRRLGHYDYWADKVRRSVLLDAKADLLIYGMGERAVIEIAEALDAGISAGDITWIRGTCWRAGKTDGSGSFIPEADDIILPEYDEICGTDMKAKAAYGKSFAMQYRSNDSVNGRRIIEKYTDSCSVVQNPPQPPLEEMELDDLYALPYMRTYHPSYEKDGGVPAIEEVKFSITANRGCFGGCAFCAITYHQGREVRSRSKSSVVDEARLMTRDPAFKGYIHDVGGPTANFHHPSCQKQLQHGMCGSKDCLFPKPCSQLDTDHSDYVELLRAVRSVEGVKKVFVRSGVRYDYLLAGWKGGGHGGSGKAFFEELCRHHVSGVLKVAPEHVSDQVLRQMHKPPVSVFDRFSSEYRKFNREAGLKQYMIPYFISSHPGSTLEDAIQLALYMKETGFVPDQVQDFYPTPGTLATCVYYTEHDPFTGKPVYVAKDIKEKKMQRALLHFHKKENRHLVAEALREAGRPELIPVLR
ncbi:MAG: YgiQ family radical SAM protein [Bacillota bacterium]|nr:YgiQ family radical SAM protein [Bacillota bacterium]